MRPFKLRFDLNPVSDGIVFVEDKNVGESGELNALVIATNGEMKIIGLQETNAALMGLDGREGSFSMGDDKEYVAFYNSDKIIDIGDERYFIGSVIVIKVCGYEIYSVEKEDVDKIAAAFEERLGILSNGNEKLTAIRI